MLVGVRQQGQEARALDRNSELALIERLRARDAAGDDLARLGDVALQRGEIFVVNVLHTLGCEAAELLPARKTATAATAATSTTAAAIPAGAAAISATTTAATTTRAISTHSHLKFPLRVDAAIHVDARFALQTFSPAGLSSSSDGEATTSSRTRRGGRSPSSSERSRRGGRSPSSSPSSRRSRRRPPSPSSSAALAIGEGSVTAASMLTTR